MFVKIYVYCREGLSHIYSLRQIRFNIFCCCSPRSIYCVISFFLLFSFVSVPDPFIILSRFLCFSPRVIYYIRPATGATVWMQATFGVSSFFFFLFIYFFKETEVVIPFQTRFYLNKAPSTNSTGTQGS